MTLHLGIPAAVSLVGAIGFHLLPGKWAEMEKIAFAAGMVETAKDYATCARYLKP